MHPWSGSEEVIFLVGGDALWREKVAGVVIKHEIAVLDCVFKRANHLRYQMQRM